MRVQLRDDYQVPAVEAVRQALRDGARSVLINAPTGSGKTVLASALMEMAMQKKRRANFVVDRLSLVQQTSDTFDRYGLEHGVIQSTHPRYRPSLPIQLCSVQTLSRRGWPEADLDMIDEAHVLHETVKQRIASKQTIVIGLTATPFTKGLAQHFDRVVNVTTTRWLIGNRWLVPYRMFSCAEPDMEGVRVKSSGEWDDTEASKRALQVVGDVVQEYLKHGDGRKFICSAVDTAHVEELARQFLAAGINVATYTYKDRDEDRAETVAEFRRPESTIKGLITVTAASRGFDVPDVGAIIMARPLRKSLAEHIQLLGRGLRISPDTGKTDCVVLDHSGNCIASGMRVLTDRGLVPIEQIQPTDKVWDGHEFVRHGGLINRGVRRVIRYAGLTATPDHRVKTPQGWRTIGCCAEEQAPIVTTGIGWLAVRERAGYLTGPDLARSEGATLRARSLRVCRLRLPGGDFVEQSSGWSHEGLPRVQPAAQGAEVALRTSAADAAALHQAPGQWLRELRRAWNQVQLRLADGVRALDRSAPWGAGRGARHGVRPDGQQRPLRAGQHQVGDQDSEQQQSPRFSLGTDGSQVQTRAPGGALRGRHPQWVDRIRSFVRGDLGPMACAVEEAEGQVWDLLDCGPRNSFTCEGLLVHNCARFFNECEDFFDNGLDELDDGKPKPKKTAEKPESEPVKCPTCRVVHKPSPFCPACGHEYPKKRAVEHVPGSLKELLAGGAKYQRELARDIFPQIAAYTKRLRADDEQARRMAQAIFKDMTGEFARVAWDNVKPMEPTPEVLSRIRSQQIKFAKRRQAATA